MAADLLGSMRVEIVGDNSKLDKSIDKSENKTKEYGKSSEKLAKSLKTLFSGIAFAAVAKKIFDISKRASELAASGEEVRSKFNAVFKDGAEDVKAWAEEYSSSVGRSDTQTLSFLATLQDTFVPMGIARDTASEFSKTMVELSGDLGSFNDVAQEDVIRDLQSALVGNHETMRKYGVVINETTLLQEAMNSGLVETKSELTEEIKIRARMNLILAGTKDAQGDLLRTQESTTNVNAALNSQIEKTLEVYGGLINEGLLPFKKNLLDEIKVINSNIQAHFLRNKVLAGEATAVEKLILQQTVLTKAERELQQAKDNLAVSTARMEENLNSENIQQQRSAQAVQALIPRMEELIRTRENAVVTAQKQVEGVQRLVNEEKAARQAVIDQSLAIDENTESTKENIEAKAEAAEAEREAAEEKKELLDEELNNRLKHADEIERAVILSNISMAESAEESALAEAKAVEDAESRKKAARAATLQAAITIANALQSIADQRAANARAELEEFLSINETEISALEAKALTAEGLTAAEQKTLSDFNDKKKELLDEQYDREVAAFNIKKALRIANVVIDTASAISAAYAELGYIGGTVVGIILTALGVTNAALIGAEEPPPKPAFAQGGIVAGSSFVGDNVPIAVNSGELVANQEQKDRALMAFLNGESNSRGSSQVAQRENQRPIVINAQIDKKTLFKVLYDGSKQGKLLTASRSVI